MDPFSEYIFSTMERAILGLHPEDIYALGLHIFCVDDDLRCPAVYLWTNTLAHARLHSPENREKRRGDAYHYHEAMWNESYWIWKTLATVGNVYLSYEGDYFDQTGIELRKAWIEGSGLWYDDELEENDFDAALEIGGKIVREFDELCLDVARKLHPVIQKKFQKDLPIIFFNRESPDHESIAMTFLANPSELLEGYALFICTDCGEEWAEFFKQEIDKASTPLSSLLDHPAKIDESD
jgi:hypothetical protein